MWKTQNNVITKTIYQGLWKGVGVLGKQVFTYLMYMQWVMIGGLISDFNFLQKPLSHIAMEGGMVIMISMSPKMFGKIFIIFVD